MADSTGETDRSTLRLDFDRRLILQFRGSTITPMRGCCWSTASWTTCYALPTAADMLADARTDKNGRHRLSGLLRQSPITRLRVPPAPA